jgi:hypothetical protein
MHLKHLFSHRHMLLYVCCVACHPFVMSCIYCKFFFVKKFLSARMDYFVPYYMSEIEQTQKREDASSDQLLPDITFYVYQFPFIIWIIPICIFYGNTLFSFYICLGICNTTKNGKAKHFIPDNSIGKNSSQSCNF